MSAHVAYDVRIPAQAASGPALGLDAGVTEVLASSAGAKYGQGYGDLLERLCEVTAKTGKARNRLSHLARQAQSQGDAAKAARIRRRNPGQGKLRARRIRGEAAVKTVVGQAVRQALRSRPAVVVVEDLSRLRGRTRSRKLSRIVSRWARSALRERVEFRVQAGGPRLETVNAAYTSQASPDPSCGYVHRDSRHGGRFHCLRCGRDGDADVVAASNVLARADDPEIRRCTPVDTVKRVLDDRFRRRKETGNRAGGVGNGTPLPLAPERNPLRKRCEPVRGQRARVSDPVTIVNASAAASCEPGFVHALLGPSGSLLRDGAQPQPQERALDGPKTIVQNMSLHPVSGKLGGAGQVLHATTCRICPLDHAMAISCPA